MFHQLLQDKVTRIILGVYAVVYSAYALLTNHHYFGQHDGRMYYRLAMASLEQGAWSCWLYQQSHWPPAWIELTATLYRIFGPHPLAVKAFLVLCVIGLGAIVYLWARQVFSVALARVATILTLSTVYMLKFVTFHQYEIFISFCMMATGFLVFQIFRKNDLTKWQQGVIGVITGVLMSACVLSSSKTVLVALVFAFFLLLFSLKKKVWITVTLYSLIGSVVFGLWVKRNYDCFDKFIPLTTNGGIVFYMANGPGTKLKRYSNPYDYEEFITPENTKNYESDKWYQYAKDYMRAHPWTTVKRVGARFVLFLNPHYVDQIFGMGLFLFSVILLLRRKYALASMDPLIWLTIVGIFWVLHSFYQYEPRYVLPVWPFMVLFGVGALRDTRIGRFLERRFS